MSIRRWAANADTTQMPIVEALRKAGYVVEIIRMPVDILFRHPTWPANVWKLADAKTIREGNKKVYIDKRQKKQNEFIAAHSIPKWTSPEQALREIAEIRELRA